MQKKFLFLIGIMLLLQPTACGQIPREIIPTASAQIQTPKPTSTPSPTITAETPSLPPVTPTLSPLLASMRIAFTQRSGKLWLWQNGIALPLTDIEIITSVSISDDGELIAFARDGLWVINSDGTNERLLVGSDDFMQMEPVDPGVSLYHFDWIPNTHQLLFNTFLLQDYGFAAADDLHLVDADTGERTILRQPGEGGRFVISPDGQRVVMTTPSQIRLMNIDGSNVHLVMEYYVPYPSEYAYYASPIWAQDSRSLTVPIPPEDFYYGTTSPTVVWRLPIDGTQPTIIEQLPAGDSGYDERIWSPNRQHFAVWLDATTSYHLDTDGTTLNPLTETGARNTDFAWVDDSHFLYYVGGCDLRLGMIGAPSISIDTMQASDQECWSNFDFAK